MELQKLVQNATLKVVRYVRKMKGIKLTVSHVMDSTTCRLQVSVHFANQIILTVSNALNQHYAKSAIRVSMAIRLDATYAHQLWQDVASVTTSRPASNACQDIH